MSVDVTKRNWFLALASLMLSLGVNAPRAQVLSLEAAFEKSVDQDPQSRSMHSQWIASKEKITQVEAKFFPQVQYSLGKSNTQRREMDSIFNDRDYKNRQWGLDFQIPLYRRENGVLLTQAKIEHDMAYQRWEMARNDALLKTAKTYVDALKAQRHWVHADQQVRRAKIRRHYLQQQHDKGLASEMEANDAAAKYLYAQSQHLFAETDMQNKRQELQRLVRTPFDSLRGLPESIPLQVLAEGHWVQWATCLAQAPEVHPSILLGQLGLDLNRSEVARANAEFYPTVDMTLARQGVDQTGNTYSALPNRYVENAVSLKLIVPIFNGGGSLAKQREAMALAEKSQAALDAALEQVKTTHIQSTQTLRNMVRMDAILTQAQQVTHRAMRFVRLGISGGVKSEQDVLNAQEEHQKRLFEYEQARYDTVNELIKLLSLCHNHSQPQLKKLSDQMTLNFSLE